MKKYTEFMNEAKTPKEETHNIGAVERSGITAHPKVHHDSSHKAFDIHYEGEHIGHINSYSTSAVQKKNSVRMQDSGKMRTKWAYQHNEPGSRTGFQMSSRGDATKELVGQHLRKIGKY